MNPLTLLKSALPRWRKPALPAVLTSALLPLLLLAIAITALVLLLFWRDQSGYKPVFGAREKIAASDMMGVLDSEHIPYRLHPDSGQVLVPEGDLGKVRMLLAAKGVTARLPAGLELMDRNDPLGVSQFVQDVRFRRGLEGELALSIMTLDAIAGARVHLAIAHSSSFVASDGDKSSASVVLAMKPGQALGREQIAAIVNLVAGSVTGLAPQRVSLIDQAGNYLSARVDLDYGFEAGTDADSQQRQQEQIRANVRGLLGPVIGEANFKLSVTAAVDNDRVEETLEKYGAAPKVTSEATRDEQERNRLVLGVPGSLSNRAPAAPAPAPVPAPAPAPVSAAAGTGPAGADASPARPDDGSARKNASTRQYAYDRSVTQIKRSRGRLQKLSVAVVLNSAAAPGPAKGWSPAQLASVEQLLRTGLGIDSGRGDSLAVSALVFPAAPAPLPWWQQRDNLVDASGWALWLAGALLVFFSVLRPLARQLMKVLAAQLPAPQPAPLLAQAATAAALPRPEAGGAMPVVPLLEHYDLPPAGSAVDVMVDHLKVLAAKEPERVAEVVKQWMQKHGRPV